VLQLKHLKYLNEMSGAPYFEIKPVKFGYSIGYSAAATYVLASQEVPANMTLCVLRVQCYLVNIDNAASDFQFYRSAPEGLAWWIQARDTGSTSLQNWTNPNAPSFLALDCDELLLFPGGTFANLLFTASGAAPSGDWQIRTTVFGYFVPPRVTDALSGPQDFINVQQ
jgi:hypothetical protein